MVRPELVSETSAADSGTAGEWGAVSDRQDVNQRVRSCGRLVEELRGFLLLPTIGRLIVRAGLVLRLRGHYIQIGLQRGCIAPNGLPRMVVL